MPERTSIFKVLSHYFFRRFFENDLLEASGDTTTTVVRALAAAAAPGLLLAFFLQVQYPQRSAWGRVEDHYFFVLYSFLAMAGVAVFEWEMLFPDRLDFLVLSPLPLQRRRLLGAKAAALAAFLGLFLLAANVFGLLLLPVVSKDNFPRQFCAHALAVLSAGAFGALAVLAIGGVLLCLLPPRLFRRVSPLLQMLTVAVMGLLLIHYVRFADVLDKVLAAPLGRAQFIPTFWFLGVYESILRGSSAAAFARPTAHTALLATVISLALVAITYPLAWVRMQRMTVEGEAGLRPRTAIRVTQASAVLIPVASRRAVIHFIGQTIARNSRYQVYLAMYCGVGLSLAVACAVTVNSQRHSVRLMLSPMGLRAVMPLLLFWAVAGLRIAFALPLNLPARWVFRITGAVREVCISGGRLWATTCAMVLLLLLLPVLAWAGLGGRALLVQAIVGACLSAVMVDSMMFADRGIPFAQPRTPAKTNLPLLLTLFIGVLPVFCFCMVRIELWLEHRPLWLLPSILIVPVVHSVATALRRRSQPLLEDGDEIEPEFQLLGLGVD